MHMHNICYNFIVFHYSNTQFIIGIYQNIMKNAFMKTIN